MKSETLDEAAKRLLEIFEKHAEGLPEAERVKRWKEFQKVVDKAGQKPAD